MPYVEVKFYQVKLPYLITKRMMVGINSFSENKSCLLVAVIYAIKSSNADPTMAHYRIEILMRYRNFNTMRALVLPFAAK